MITFASGVRGTINLKSALPTLRGEVAIKGPGAGTLTVRLPTANRSSVFAVAEGATVNISGLTITHGFVTTGDDGHGISQDERSNLTVANSIVSGNGGEGIYSALASVLTIRDSTVSKNNSGGVHILAFQDTGTRLTVEGSTFVGNSAVTGRDHETSGAGIHNLNALVTIRNSTFSRNTAGERGGYFGNKGKLTVANSTFSENTASSEGGGIFNGSPGSTITNSTFSGNEAVRGGGIYNNDLNLSVVASTFAANTATGSGGGVYNALFAPAFSLRGTILANNEAPTGPNASGAFSSDGYNLIGNTNGATGFGPTDLTYTRSGLDPRGPRDNGGPTKTIALVSSSPAVDAVRRDACPPPATDQRDISRPQDGDGDGLARCDIGAYERRAT